MFTTPTPPPNRVSDYLIGFSGFITIGYHYLKRTTLFTKVPTLQSSCTQQTTLERTEGPKPIVSQRLLCRCIIWIKTECSRAWWDEQTAPTECTNRSSPMPAQTSFSEHALLQDLKIDSWLEWTTKPKVRRSTKSVVTGEGEGDERRGHRRGTSEACCERTSMPQAR